MLVWLLNIAFIVVITVSYSTILIMYHCVISTVHSDCIYTIESYILCFYGDAFGINLELT